MVMPMEKEIVALKEKLSTTEEKVEELEASKVSPKNRSCKYYLYKLCYTLRVLMIREDLEMHIHNSSEMTTQVDRVVIKAFDMLAFIHRSTKFKCWDIMFAVKRELGMAQLFLHDS